VQNFTNIAADKVYQICETQDPKFHPIERKLDDHTDYCAPWRQSSGKHK
jgi:hypothetical protein